MVALPSTGVEWHEKYGYNPLGIRKGIITNILIRDYHGSLTSLADPAVGHNSDGYFTPYAQDGGYRDDLLDIDFPGGQFFDLGGIKDDGTKVSQDTSVEETMIAQSRRPQRFDLGKEGDEVGWTYREDNPGVDALRFDKPLANLPDIGKVGYFVAKPAEGNLIERQVIALAEDGDQRFAYIFPRVGRKKVGDTQLNRKNPHELMLAYGAILCPYAKYPVGIAREGAGWRALGGSPKFSGTPTATQTGATTATVAFTIPTLLLDPAPDSFTYTLEKKTGGVWSGATIGTPSVSGTTVTLPVTSLTTATAYTFRVTATGGNAAAAVSSESNSITTA